MTPTPCRIVAVALCALVLSFGRPGPAQARPFDDPPQAVIEVFKNGAPIAEGQTVSGTIRARLTVHNAVGHHVQFYGNMVVLDPVDGPPHMMVDASPWERTFYLNTSMFYDGENLLSAHVHPHPVPGEPFSTELTVGTFRILSGNNRPAPGGDIHLPTLQWGTVNFFQYDATYLYSQARLLDDGPANYYDGTGYQRGQLLPHLGSSILGRERWPNSQPPFGSGDEVHACNVVPFQREAPFAARLVFFFSDSVGRANYAFTDFVMPALVPGLPFGRDVFGLPALDAKVLGVHPGDEIVMSYQQDHILQIQVSNIPQLESYEWFRMTTWVGNRPVAITFLEDYVSAMEPGQTSFVAEVAIPYYIIEWDESWHPATTAIAVWNDFTWLQGASGDMVVFKNIPAGQHVHLNSLRTSALPWPNAAPVVVEDAAETVQDQPVDIQVLSNDFDPDEDGLQVVGVTPPAHGTVSIRPDGTVRYAPQACFEGVDSFLYTAGDGQGGEDSTVVTVKVERAALSIGSVTPSSGPVTGGTIVLVEGAGFSAAARVTFGGRIADVRFVDCRRLYAVTPKWPGRPTVVDVMVFDSNGTAMLRGGFKYGPGGSAVSRQ